MGTRILGILLLACSFCNAQSLQYLIIGEWVEVRRENREGHYLNSPAMELSFDSNGTGTFYNSFISEPKATLPYTFENPKVLRFGRSYEIIKLDKENLVVIPNTFTYKSSNDLKCYFIRKSAYKSLSLDSIYHLAAPTHQDLLYRDSCNEARNIRFSEVSLNYGKYVTTAEVIPKFFNGNSTLDDYIKKRIKTPDSNLERNAAYVSFIIEPNGITSNVKMVIPIMVDLEKQLLNVFEELPQWKPAMQKGKPVRYKMIYELKFY